MLIVATAANLLTMHILHFEKPYLEVVEFWHALMSTPSACGQRDHICCSHSTNRLIMKLFVVMLIVDLSSSPIRSRYVLERKTPPHFTSASNSRASCMYLVN